MTGPALLDLNDSNLQLWCAGEAVQSPGYALLDGKQYTFGSVARSAARLRPRDINTRYWWQLNTEGLQPALGPARHTADLVHAHLLDMHKQAGQPEEIILAASGSMQRDQLALLLGIVEQCPFNAVGLVNRSVALASTVAFSGNLFHLEIQLHQAVITQLSQSTGQVNLHSTTPLPGCGLLQLQERLVEIIAAAFVRQTRFDPRRKAESEQQLYDALPAALRALGSAPETNIEVMGYRARINNNDLRPAGDVLFKTVGDTTGVLHPQDRIIIDPVAGLLPGLLEKLPQADLIDGAALHLSVGQHLDALMQVQVESSGQALHFVTSLPQLATHSNSISHNNTASDSPPQVSAEPIRVVATHLLLDTVAMPLSQSGTSIAANGTLYFEQGNLLLKGSEAMRVNGNNYLPGQALFCGDSFTWDGEFGSFSALLILVKEP
jgi:hypothetical protein